MCTQIYTHVHRKNIPIIVEAHGQQHVHLMIYCSHTCFPMLYVNIFRCPKSLSDCKGTGAHILRAQKSGSLSFSYVTECVLKANVCVPLS